MAAVSRYIYIYILDYSFLRCLLWNISFTVQSAIFECPSQCDYIGSDTSMDKHPEFQSGCESRLAFCREHIDLMSQLFMKVSQTTYTSLLGQCLI